jgi:hypothetical protein
VVGVNGSAAEAPRLRSRTLRVDPDPALLERFRELFGAGRVRLARR